VNDARKTRAPSDQTGVRAILFDSQGADRALATLSEVDASNLSETQLLWIDVADVDSLGPLTKTLSLPEGALASVASGETSPILRNGGKYFWLRVVAVTVEDGLRFQGTSLTIIGGDNLVVSVHADPLSFIEELRKREEGDSDLGSLSSASFIVALLDWHLSTYFEAVADFELAVDRLEESILSEKRLDCLEDLRTLRKGASRLRRMLAPHRTVFAGLARPDFRPTEEQQANEHFLSLDTRFERAMDMVENSRDLVIGSFELFSSQTALKTNDTMRVLTFATVVIGLLAVLAGVLGMNFDAPFFRSAGTGFWLAVAIMATLAIAAVLVGKRKHWL